MGHYASEMGYSSGRDATWLKWGFKSVAPLLICPVCYATVPEYRVNMSNGDTPDEYRLPWMEHILWHRKVHANDSTFGWQWPALYAKDKQEGWDLGEQLRNYDLWKTFPGDSDS